MQPVIPIAATAVNTVSVNRIRVFMSVSLAFAIPIAMNELAEAYKPEA